MTTPQALRWGGWAAIAAGITYPIAISLRGFGWAPLAGQAMSMLIVVVLCFAFTAVYAVQSDRTGRSGLLGYVLIVFGLFMTEIVAFLLLAGYAGESSAHDLQMFAWGGVPIIGVAVLSNTIGGLLFGSASVRAGVLPSWAGWALVTGHVVNVAVEIVFPFPQLMIVPAVLLATALVGFGQGVLTRIAVEATAPALEVV
jgi:hypothetical protein